MKKLIGLSIKVIFFIAFVWLTIGYFSIDMDAKNDIKTQYWYLFLYGVSFVAFLMSSIKRALLTKLFILAISLIYVVGSIKMVFLMNFISSYTSSNIALKMTYAQFLVFSVLTILVHILDNTLPKSKLLVFKKETIKNESNIIYGLLVVSAIAGLMSIYYLGTLGIPYISVDHFSFRSAMGSNLILATIARWLAYVGSFSLLYLFSFRKNWVLVFPFLFAIFIMFLWGSRTMLATSLGAGVLAFIILYQRKLGQVGVKKMFKIYIIGAGFMLFFIVGIEMIRTRGDWMGKSQTEMSYFLAVNLGLYNQMVIADGVIMRNEKVSEYYSNDYYLSTVVKGLIPGSALRMVGLKKTEATGDVYNKVLNTDNPLGISIGHINEMYLKRHSPLIPAIVLSIIGLILFLADRFIRSIDELDAKKLLTVHFCLGLFFSAIIFNFTAAGSGAYYAVYIYLPPYLFLRFCLSLKVKTGR